MLWIFDRVIIIQIWYWLSRFRKDFSVCSVYDAVVVQWQQDKNGKEACKKWKENPVGFTGKVKDEKEI